jgi:hypothetical protein
MQSRISQKLLSETIVSEEIRDKTKRKYDLLKEVIYVEVSM